jgi:hypothetical protein
MSSGLLRRLNLTLGTDTLRTNLVKNFSFT